MSATAGPTVAAVRTNPGLTCHALILALSLGVAGCGVDEPAPETGPCSMLVSRPGAWRLPPYGYCVSPTEVMICKDRKPAGVVDCGPVGCLQRGNMWNRTMFQGCPVSTTPDPQCAEMSDQYGQYYCDGIDQVFCAGPYVVYRFDSSDQCGGTRPFS